MHSANYDLPFRALEFGACAPQDQSYLVMFITNDRSLMLLSILLVFKMKAMRLGHRFSCVHSAMLSVCITVSALQNKYIMLFQEKNMSDHCLNCLKNEVKLMS